MSYLRADLHRFAHLKEDQATQSYAAGKRPYDIVFDGASAAARH